jgi:S1-C subfamily serine protease
LIIDQAGKSVFVVRSRERENVGSGFCIASDGVVLTAAHVIASIIPGGSLGSGDVNHQATFEVASGAKSFQASVVGIDRESDIAALKVGTTFTPLTLFSGEPLVGTEVVGIGYDGNALGNLSSVASPYGVFWKRFAS